MTQRDDNTDREPDIVLKVLLRVRAKHPSLPASVVDEVEAEIKSEDGGRRLRILKRKKYPTAEQRKAIVKDALQPGTTDQELTQRHGIGRATLYRYVKQG